jgi:hypothetical protein
LRLASRIGLSGPDEGEQTTSSDQHRGETTMANTLSFTTLDDAADLTFNQLLGINDEGKIAGYFGSGNPPAEHPNKGHTLSAPYGQGNYTNENFGGSQQTQVTGINNHNVTVGFWADVAGDNFGFVNQNGVFTDVVDPNGLNKGSGGMTVEQLLGVNDHEKAVGFWTDSAGNNHSFTYDINKHRFTEVNIAGFASTTTTAIDNKGDIAGSVVGAGGNDVGFVKEGSKIVWLNGPSNAVSVQALGINNEREVVGSYVDTTGATHGFLYDQAKNTYTTIDDPNGITGPTGMTVANGINDKGQVVGFTWTRPAIRTACWFRSITVDDGCDVASVGWTPRRIRLRCDYASPRQIPRPRAVRTNVSSEAMSCVGSNAAVSGTSSTRRFCQATIRSNLPSAIRSTARTPNAEATNRSSQVGWPPRCTWPSTVTRVSAPVI